MAGLGLDITLIAMKYIQHFVRAAVVAVLLAGAVALRADDQKKAKLIPYPLKTCVVSGEKLDSGMGKPFIYEYKGREIKFCCKDCQKDFDKNPAKYIKILEKAEAKAK
jgi:YHS domain-containing protein